MSAVVGICFVDGEVVLALLVELSIGGDVDAFDGKTHHPQVVESNVAVKVTS